MRVVVAGTVRPNRFGKFTTCLAKTPAGISDAARRCCAEADGKRLISQEVEKLSRRPAAARPAPPPQAATLTVSGGAVTIQDGDEVHIDIHLHFTVTAPGDGDHPSLNVRVQ